MGIADFKTQQVVSEAQRPDSRIGSLLVQAGKLSPEEAQRIADMQHSEKLRFGELAIKLEIVSNQDVQNVLAKQSGQLSLASPPGTMSREVLDAVDYAGTNIDQLQGMRSQLLMDWFAQDNKTLLFTAPMEGEGVSHVVAGLAVIFACLPKRTLLIDANLRSPRQQELFQIENDRPGLAAILEGRAGLETICSVNDIDHLSILPAGMPPRNPSELLSRDAFAKLLSDCAGIYDAILIDGPSATAPELAVLAGRARGMAVVAQPGRTGMSAISHVAQVAKRADARLVGAILNQK